MSDLEVLSSALDPAEYSRTAELRTAGFTYLPLTPQIARRARQIQAMLARPTSRRGCADVFTVAIAEQYGAIVLHYDTNVDHIAAVSGLQTRWVVPRGTIP